MAVPPDNVFGACEKSAPSKLKAVVSRYKNGGIDIPPLQSRHVPAALLEGGVLPVLPAVHHIAGRSAVALGVETDLAQHRVMLRGAQRRRDFDGVRRAGRLDRV